MKHRWLGVLAACLVFWMGGCAAWEKQPIADGAAPNIVLIMADDLGFSDIGCYGSEIPTPNLDQLASNGLRFTQFYNAARCCPTRAALMSGLYPHQAGIGHMLGSSNNGQYDGDLRRDCVTLAEVLKTAGYRTYMSGKWHLTPWPGKHPDLKDNQKNWPLQRGFDKFYGTIASIRSYYSPPSLAEGNKPLPPPKGDFHYTDAISDHAVKFIEDHPEGSPFFLYVAHTAPHWPIHAREKDIARHLGKYAKGWDALRVARRNRLIELGLMPKGTQLAPRDGQSIAWEAVAPKHRAWFDRRMAVYAAMVEQMDRGIGQLVGALKQQGQLDNTLIVFLSDNGGCAEEIGPKGRAKGFPLKTRDGRPIRLGNDPSIPPGAEDTYPTYGLEWAFASNAPFRRFKSFVHEGGIATPMVVHWPGRIQPGVNRQVGHVIDFMPTFLEAAGAAYPKQFAGQTIQPIEGQSLLPSWRGREGKTQRSLGWEHEGNRAFRIGDWKLVSRDGSPWELFNLAEDRLELNDLVKKHPGRAAAMQKQYAAWAKRCGVMPWQSKQTPIGWPDPQRHAR